ncbi:cobalamin adenosyltransferase [Oceanobacillus sp. CAU 1775]
MAVLTESTLRSLFISKKIKESIIELPKGTIVTPAAKSYLQDRKITIEFVNDEKQAKGDTTKNKIFTPEPKEEATESITSYQLLNGGFLEGKPEHMTTLTSNLLVPKNHRRIVLRGQLDSLQAKIIEFQFQLAEKNSYRLVEDLQEVLTFVMKLLEVEVTEKSLGEFQLLNLNEKEIHKMGICPEDYFSVKLPLPDYKMGIEVVLLNVLRTKIREIEITAYEAFITEDGSLERTDILLALNRLSSLCHVMMYKVKAGDYAKEKEGGNESTSDRNNYKKSEKSDA